jgi:inositol-phosphate phosphatase/L-galactose 1-phosphate phosphatase/histidinol-phosphatase
VIDKNIEFEQFVNEILDLSGEIALNYFRKIRNLTLKGDFSPVTKADEDIEQFIRDKIFEKYPNHKIIGEELDDFEGSENITWYIDPIDVTRSFVAGKRDFGTLVALVINDELIGGVIDCPALGERWTSFSLYETKVNHKITRCKAVDNLKDAVMATTSSHEFGMKKWRAYQLLEQSVKVTTTGSDCYNYGLLASGHVDIVAERLTSPHDYLPLIKIVEGAGGIMTDWEGKKLDFNQSNVYVLASASK